MLEEDTVDTNIFQHLQQNLRRTMGKGRQLDIIIYPEPNQLDNLEPPHAPASAKPWNA